MYNSYFGFSVSPFSVTPDPSFFYTNLAYQEAYAKLQYGIKAKKGLIVITGEAGTGKTTLLRKLMTDHLHGPIQTVFVSNTYLDFTELLQVIHHDLGLGIGDANKLKLLQELNEYLITQLKQSHVVSVLVDEAQYLSDDALEGLRLLSNLEINQERLIQIVLMGRPATLRQLKQRVGLQCRLFPLIRSEVGPYIDFRLWAAGYTSNDLFSPDAVRLIATYSYGIPRLVNIICDNALLTAYARNQQNVSAEVIKQVARDLSLGLLEEQSAQAEIAPAAAVTKSEPAMPDDGRFLSLAEQATPRLQRQRRNRSLTWVPVGVALALGALGGAAATLYSPQIKGYLAKVLSAENSPLAIQYLYQNRSVTFRTSEPELSVPRWEGAARDRTEPENSDKDRLSLPQSTPNSEQAQPQESAPKKKDPRLGVFEVVGGSSFLRGSPGPDAKIVATLEPSTRVKVVSAKGDYLQVQTVFEGKTIRGYVHREDALFERPKKDKQRANGTGVITGVN
jgi:type II secretory pathway predicted ATPase ExeA